MLVARLNRGKLRVLSDSRLQEARVLLDHKLWTGAYYMTGLSVECALKAYLAQAVQQYDFPDKGFVNRAYTHKLKDLAQLDDALWHQLETDTKADAKLKANWAIVLGWDDENRYEIVEESAAMLLYNATTETGTGAMEWIRRRWK